MKPGRHILLCYLIFEGLELSQRCQPYGFVLYLTAYILLVIVLYTCRCKINLNLCNMLCMPFKRPFILFPLDFLISVDNSWNFPSFTLFLYSFRPTLLLTSEILQQSGRQVAKRMAMLLFTYVRIFYATEVRTVVRDKNA